MMPSVRFQILYPLGRRQNEHHRKDGHSTKTLEGERHNFKFYVFLCAFGANIIL
jgi:hypothetical protein